MKIKRLTKAEEEVMQQLWELDKCSVQDIIDQLPEPKPAYNTVSTIVRILEGKAFVDHQKKGRGHLYYPIVKKEDYSNFSMNNLVEGYFQGSFKSMVSFFMKNNDISLSELESVLKEVKKNKDHE